MAFNLTQNQKETNFTAVFKTFFIQVTALDGKGRLRSVTVQGISLVAKEWLAEFMAGDGMRIWQKSEVHRRMLSLIRHR